VSLLRRLSADGEPGELQPEPVSGLLRATQPCMFDNSGGVPVTIAEGTIVLSGSPVVQGHESFFEPLTIVLAHDDVPRGLASVTVVGSVQRSGYLAWTRLQIESPDAPGLGG
jgi:hypothetical protein